MNATTSTTTDGTTVGMASTLANPPLRFTLSSVRSTARDLSNLGIGDTPLVRAELNGQSIYLKLELANPTGSYKVRAAASVLDAAGIGAGGCVTASTGNFAAAASFVAGKIGIGMTIVVPRDTPSVKIDRIRSSGPARIVEQGDTFDEAQVAARGIADASGEAFVHPFDDVATIRGNATLGLELAETRPDMIVLPGGGGGLSSGTALGLEADGQVPETHVVGSEAAPALVRSINARSHAPAPTAITVAEAIRVGSPGQRTVGVLARLGAMGHLVSEAEIIEGMRWLSSLGIRAEGGGCVGVAALLAGRIEPRGLTVVVVTGGNISPDVHGQLIKPA